jgi:hypothetical protein
MVEVFKTNIDNGLVAEEIRKLLLDHLPDCKVNFDLEDCDKILRVEGFVSTDEVIRVINDHNFRCEILE